MPQPSFSDQDTMCPLQSEQRQWNNTRAEKRCGTMRVILHDTRWLAPEMLGHEMTFVRDTGSLCRELKWVTHKKDGLHWKKNEAL